MSKGTVNKAIILGRLGKDPELRYTPSGTAVANFSIATNSSFKDSDGNWSDKTEWHNIVAFGKTAENVGEYLKKGSQAYIEGRLQTSSWEDNAGVRKYKTEILVDTLQFIGGKSDDGGGSQGQREQPAMEQEPATQQEPTASTVDEDDDLPF